MQAILASTDEDYPDYKHLKQADDKIAQVADRINEIKKRKDIVERYVGSRKRTDADVSRVVERRFVVD